MIFCLGLPEEFQTDVYSSLFAKVVIFSEYSKEFGGYFLFAVPLQQKTNINRNNEIT
jgi:hypothetical protein